MKSLDELPSSAIDFILSMAASVAPADVDNPQSSNQSVPSTTKAAGEHFKGGHWKQSVQLLLDALRRATQDPKYGLPLACKVLHNIAVAEYYSTGGSQAKTLCTILQAVEETVAEADVVAALERSSLNSTPGAGLNFRRNQQKQQQQQSSRGGGEAGSEQGDTAGDPSLSAFVATPEEEALRERLLQQRRHGAPEQHVYPLSAVNRAIALFNQQKFSSAKEVLDPIFDNVESVDKYTALRLCCLLMDIALRTNRLLDAKEPLLFLERTFRVALDDKKADADSQRQDSSNLDDSEVGRSAAAAGGQPFGSTKSAVRRGAGVGAAGGGGVGGGGSIEESESGGREGGEGEEEWVEVGEFGWYGSVRIAGGTGGVRSSHVDFPISKLQVKALILEYRIQILLQARALRQAKEEVQSLLQLDPSNLRALLLNAQLEFLCGDFNAALHLLNSASFLLSSSLNPNAIYSSPSPPSSSPQSTAPSNYPRPQLSSPAPSSTAAPTESAAAVPHSASASSSASAHTSFPSSSTPSSSSSISSSTPSSVSAAAATATAGDAAASGPAAPRASFIPFSPLFHSPNPSSTSVSLSLSILSNSGCVHRAASKPNMAAVFFSKSLKVISSLSQLSLSSQAFSVGNLSESKIFSILFNFGVNHLLVGNPLQASRCFQESLGLFHSRPFLWLRLAECCLAAQEKGLLSENLPGKLVGRSQEDEAQLPPDAIVVRVAGEGRERKVILPAAGVHFRTPDNLPKASGQGQAEKKKLSGKRELGSEGSKNATNSRPDSPPIPEGMFQLASVPALGQELSLSFGGSCLRNAIHFLDQEEQEVTAATVTNTAEDKQGMNERATMVSGQDDLSAKRCEARTMVTTVEEAFKLFAEEKRERNFVMRMTALTQLAYIELCLGNYHSCLTAAEAVLEGPRRSLSHVFCCRMYAAEALCRLGRVHEALAHLLHALTEHMDSERDSSVERSHQEKDVRDDGKWFAGRLGVESLVRKGATAFQQDPKKTRVTLLVNMAAVHSMNGDFGQAQACATQALTTDPTHPIACLAMVYSQIRDGKKEEALRFLSFCRTIRVQKVKLEMP